MPSKSTGLEKETDVWSVNYMGYECFHCLKKTVCWDADYDFEDFAYEGEGIVHMCHCTNCGAEIEYRVRTVKGEDE